MNRCVGIFAPRVLLPLLAIAVAGCSGPGGGPGSPSGGSLSDKLTSTMFGSPSTARAPQETETLECPPIDVRQGASTYAIYAAGERTATNVRYQGTIADTARECGFVGSTVSMKVGIQGRVIVGPAGSPGRVELPLRIAVVHEGPDPKTIWTKTYRVAVDVSGANTTFDHIEPNITFPKPAGSAIDAYVIYAGYDPAATGKDQPKAKSRKTRQSARTQ